ncbi:MAG: hypothetical protein HY302_08310 [Opitutae bacterium]|nr:hypothetical protein [Opitutae bacterium]
MSSSTTHASRELLPAKRWTALGCAVLVWALGILAASPQLHASLHRDAGQLEHSCAVTLFSHGAENSAPPVRLNVAPTLVVVGMLAPSEPLSVESVRDWLQPGRGPPLR